MSLNRCSLSRLIRNRLACLRFLGLRMLRARRVVSWGNGRLFRMGAFVAIVCLLGRVIGRRRVLLSTFFTRIRCGDLRLKGSLELLARCRSRDTLARIGPGRRGSRLTVILRILLLLLLLRVSMRRVCRYCRYTGVWVCLLRILRTLRLMMLRLCLFR